MVCVTLIVGAHKNNDKKTLTRDKKIAETFRSIAKGIGLPILSIVEIMSL